LSWESVSLMVLAGESSGDVHGGRLCRCLRERAPGLRFFGMGGEEMAAAKVELIHRITPAAVIGFWEAFKSLGRYRRIFRRLIGEMERRRPAAVILIDYPGFNLRFARAAHRRGIKVIYYITPQVWAWGRGRIKSLRRYVDKPLVVFQFEKEFFRSHGLEADFVGHPVLDGIKRDLTPEISRRALGVRGEPVIGLLPGSRQSEINRLLPLLLRSAAIIRRSHPGADFVLPLASAELKPSVDAILAELQVPVQVVNGRSQEVLAASDLVIAASGTVTLEAAFFLTPVIVVYKLSILSWLIARALIKIPYIGLINIILGRQAVPEFVQFRARPGLVAAAAEKFLSEGKERSEIKESLETARRSLGGPGATERAARIILEAIAFGGPANQS